MGALCALGLVRCASFSSGEQPPTGDASSEGSPAIDGSLDGPAERRRLPPNRRQLAPATATDGGPAGDSAVTVMGDASTAACAFAVSGDRTDPTTDALACPGYLKQAREQRRPKRAQKLVTPGPQKFSGAIA